MANTTILGATKANSEIKKLTKNSKLYKAVISAILDKKGENILSLDLRKIHQAAADFFIVCEASSTTQIKAISDSVEDMVQRECNEDPYRHEGLQNLQWVIVDYVNIVVHIMLPDIRKYYRLEELWGDGAEEEIK